MNKKIVFLVFFLACLNLHAQVSKTVNITAGGLSGALTTSEKNTITNLTITGTLDARDFTTMRDSMPVIAVLDMADASIEAYSGSLGTASTSTYFYPVNTVPTKAFDRSSFKTSLTSVSLPNTATSIGQNAFLRCSGLKTITIPSSILSIGNSAFMMCSKLTNVTIPASVTYIESSAFARASGDVTVSLSNPDYCSVGGILFDKDTTTLIHCPTSKTGTYVIPATVTTLSAYAFADCWNFTSIIIPNSVTSIQHDAFYQCWGLTSVVLPSHLRSIESYVFEYCHGLTSVVIPSSVNSIGYGAFLSCDKLPSITIPMSVTSIGSYAFDFCLKMSSIYVESPEPVDLSTSVDVFSDINKSTCKMYVPYGTGVLYKNAYQWKDFNNIIESPGFYLPDKQLDILSTEGSTDSIPIYANENWNVLSDQPWLTVNLATGSGDTTLVFTATANPGISDRNATITVSATGVPSQTVRVTQYGIPNIYTISAGGLCDSLTSIEKNTLSNLKLVGTIDARDFKTMRDSMPALSIIDLSEATIESYSGTIGTSGSSSFSYPRDVIPNFAFCTPDNSTGKNSLRLFIIPNTVTTIGNNAFCNCDGLIRFSLTPSVTTIGSNSFKGCSNLCSFDLSSSVMSIGDNAFSGCKRVASFVLPSTLKSIGNYSFEGCAGLTSLSIPSLVNSIGSCAFKECAGLKTVIITSPVTSIPSGLFYGCGNLSSFIIPSSVTSIGSSAFSYCIALTSITIPTSVKSIGSNAFSFCSGLRSIQVPSSVTSMGNYAFRNCINLSSATLPSSITEISDYAFYYCSKLVSVNIPSSVTRIGSHAFQDAAFSYVEIPSSVETIAGFAFASCDRLTTIDIPTSVTSIGAYAFWWCTSLPSIRIPNTVSRIEEGLFSWAGGLKSITIPASITYMGSSVFYNNSNLDYIKCDNPTPVDLFYSSDVFSGVYKTTCKLYVPYGSSGLYAAANQWSDFTSIIEMPGFMLFENQVSVDSAAGSTASVDMLAYTPWTASSDQSWLTIDQTSGDNDCTLTFTATSNPFAVSRVATVTISAEGFSSQTITITQEPGAGSSIFNNLAIADMTIAGSESQCFNAYDTITVAGGETTVLCENGSSVNFIAGRSIRFLPGFHAVEGSLVQAYITTDSSFCDNVSSVIAYQPEEKSDQIIAEEPNMPIDSHERSIKVYPNPNNGRFAVVLNNFSESAEVAVYSLMGKKIFQAVPGNRTNFEIDLPTITKGFYLVKVLNGSEQYVKKIVVD